jgi:hypothetical protein
LGKRPGYIAVTIILITIAGAEMPMDYYSAMNNGGEKDVLLVKNYEAGATFTESYTDFEQLQRNTEVSTRNSVGSADPGPGGTLEASINSNVVGKAHIAWQSVDPQPDSKGRHRLIGRSIEDLTGVFSVEKFIQLWSDSRPGEISVDWLPCS